MCVEEVERLLDGHVEHVGDRLALEAHLERLAVVALAVALLARDVDVGQEVHLDLDLAVAAADLAAPALHVEGEAAGLVAAGAGLLGAREEVADLVEQADVGGRVRPRRAADRRLVDVDDLVDLVEPGDAPVGSRALLGAVQAVGHRLVEHLVHQRRLARPGDPGDGAERAERHLHVDPAQVVLGGALDGQVARRAAAPARQRDLPRAREELAGGRGRSPPSPPRGCRPRPARRRARRRPARGRPGGRPRASCPRRARPRSPCCRGRAAAPGWRSAARCRAGAARSRARRGCTGPPRATSRSAWRAGCAAPRRRRAWTLRAPATGSRRRRCRGTAAARRSRAG